MASSLPPINNSIIFNKCANCIAFGWKQPEPAALKQCKKCKVVKYCGVDCQVEHWKFIHKEHCKKLARMKQAEAGGNDLTSELPAGIPWHHILSPLPLAGLPQTTLEKLVILVGMILARMRNSSHPAALLNPAQWAEMEARMAENRLLIWECMIFTGGDPADCGAIMSLSDYLSEMNLPVTDSGDSRNLWSTLLLMESKLHQCKLILMMNSLKEPRKATPGELWNGMEDEVGVFPVRVEEIFKAFEGPQFPSFQELLGIICGGSLVQDCTYCTLSTRVGAVVEDKFKGKEPVVALLPYLPPIFTCTATKCQEQLKTTGEDWYTWSLALNTIGFGLQAHMCDFCFKASEEVHRFYNVVI